MSARGKKKADGKTRREAPERTSGPASDADEDGIEILEVVGVNETSNDEPELAPPHHRDPGLEHHPEGPSRELQEAREEAEKYHDLLLRKQADFENYRKRIEREADQASSYAMADLLRRILPVLDNLARAIEGGQGGNDPLRQGVRLIHQQLLGTLTREGLAPIEAVGEKFDPGRHEAVEMLDVPGFERGVIIEEMQRGYMFRDRLLRPALVKVASGQGSRRENAGDAGGGRTASRGGANDG